MDLPYTASVVDVTARGKKKKRGLQLWHLNSDYHKGWVHARMDWPEEQPGAWFLPRDIDDEYCRQIAAEARQITSDGKAVWAKLRRDNHMLDAEALAFFAIQLCGIALKRPVVSDKGSAAADFKVI